MADGSDNFAVLLELVKVSVDALRASFILPASRGLAEGLLLGGVPLVRGSTQSRRERSVVRVCA